MRNYNTKGICLSISCLLGLIVYFKFHKIYCNSIADLNFLFPPIVTSPHYHFLSNKDISPQNNIYLPKYQLHYCKIDKNGGTALQAAFCFLYNPGKFRELFTKGTWTPGLYNTKQGYECARETENGTIRHITINATKDKNLFEWKDIVHFAVIRDPIERFVSAWLDICDKRNAGETNTKICYGCGRDLLCFAVQHYWYIRMKAEKKKIQRWWNDWHFYPQSWNCNFEEELMHYRLVKYGERRKFVKELKDILKERRVRSNLVDTIGFTLKKRSTSHINSRNRSRTILDQIYNSKYISHILRNTYIITTLTGSLKRFEFSFE